MQHKISWLNFPGRTPETWNPQIGCSPISEGCQKCYAKTMAKRLAGNPKTPFYKGVEKWDGTLKHRINELYRVRQWKSPRVVFVGSMTDMFHETDQSLLYLNRVMDEIIFHPQHLFIMITKRAARMYNYFLDVYAPKNLIVGVTVENEINMDRIIWLQNALVKNRMISIEPNLDIDWLPTKHLKKIDWVVVGGESGPGSKPVDELSVRKIKACCESMNVPFHFKQWGGNKPGAEIDGKEYKQFPNLTI